MDIQAHQNQFDKNEKTNLHFCSDDFNSLPIDKRMPGVLYLKTHLLKINFHVNSLRGVRLGNQAQHF